MLRVLYLTYFLLTIACNSDLAVMPESDGKERISVEAFDRLAVRAGDSVNVLGKNLDPDIEAFVNDQEVDFSLTSRSQGAITLPRSLQEGLQKVSFRLKDQVIAKLPLMNGDSIDALPVLPLEAASVCDSFIFKNQHGDLVRGLGICDEDVDDCVQDGQMACETSQDFPAVLKRGLSGKLRAGESLIGEVSASCDADAIVQVDLAGAPSGVVASTTLNVAVAGDDITEYKFKVREQEDPPCSDPSGWSQAFTVDSPIATNVAGKANGPLELCVKGMNEEGKWQAIPSTVEWTKDTPQPAASFAGEPMGSTNSGLLNVAVQGDGLVAFKYKVHKVGDGSCADSSGYSAELPIGTSINEDLSADGEGRYELCVIGKDGQGKWQAEALATASQWTIDTTPPTVALANVPSITSNSAALDIDVSAPGVTHYKYKVRAAADPSCADSAGYSGAIPVSTPISENLALLPEGAYELCVIGRDSAGNWQSEALASVTSWTRDTQAPIAQISQAPTGSSSASLLNALISGTDVSHYKFKLRSSSDPACSDAQAYSTERPVASAISESLSSLVEGPIQLCVIGRDAAGNWQIPASAAIASWTKDSIPPVATLSAAPIGRSSLTSLSILVAGTDVVQYRYRIRSASEPACSDSQGYSGALPISTPISNDISAQADGDLEICVVGQDSAQNWQLEGTATIGAWTKDTEAPTATLANLPSGTSNAASLNVSVAGVDVTHYKYKLRGPADTSCSSPADYSAEVAVASPLSHSLGAFADDSIELCVIGRDSAGNWQTESAATTANWTKDTSAPTATINGAPSGTNNTATLSISVAGMGVSYYKYKLRGPSSSACSLASGYSAEIPVATLLTNSLSALPDGTVELCVIGRDGAGNWQTDGTATTASWTKDLLPPSATLSGGPSGSSSDLNLNITVAGTGVTHYKYKVREAADPSCAHSGAYSAAIPVATPITDSVAALGDGALQICVIGRDAVNNWQLEGTATVLAWTKDTTAPTASITDAPTGINNAAVLNVTIGGAGVSHYKYKIREAADALCSDNAGYSAERAVALLVSDSLSALDEGAVELCVIGRDAAGNWQTEASAAAASWTKDTTAPTATISGAPTGTASSTLLNVTIAGTDVTHYKYKVRGSADPACSNAGAYSSETPVATLITANLTAFADGVLQLCVVGRDSLGNWQTEASASSASWTKDATAPLATLSGVPSGSSLVTGLNVTVSGMDVIEYRYKIRAAADPACSSSAGYSVATAIATPITSSIAAFADGVVEICVLGKDTVGNWQAESAATAASWTKDTTAPVATLSGHPSSASQATNLNVSVAGIGLSHYKYKIREAGDAACSLSAGYSGQIAISNAISNSIGSLGDGVIEICVVGRDAAGNWQTEAAATAVSWTKDTLAPSASIGSAPSGTSNSTVLSATVGGAEVSHYKYKLREPSDAACSNASGYSSEVAVGTAITDSLAALADGVIELCVIGRDALGNWQTEASAATASWTKDALPPAATLSGAPSGSSLATSLGITVAGTSVVQYRYKIREAGDSPCSDSSDYSSAIAVATPITDSIAGLPDGAFQVCVIGQDSAGNWQLEGTATTASWTKDTTAPVATVLNAPSGESLTSTLNIAVAGAGVSHYKYKIRELADLPCSNSLGYSAQTAVSSAIADSIAGLADAVLEVCVIGRDSAGNWQTEALATAVSWTKDTAAPTAVINGAPTGTNNTSLLSITISGADLTHYKYKIRESTDSACSNALGYSAEVLVATPISANISSFDDGVFELCAIGRDSAGNWQSLASAANAAWTKDALGPTATLSGAPIGSSLTTSLNITIAGVDTLEYKYKIREAGDPACSSSSGYSAARAVATPITDPINLLADGTIEVCVIGKDNSGNWQLEAVASSANWVKDTTAPTATLSDAPTGASGITVLDVTVAGNDVNFYKYKIRESGDAACTVAAGYSAETAVSVKISDSILGLSDGTLELCVIGKDSAGNWQAEASASTVAWTKDTTAPTAAISGAPTGTNNTAVLNVSIAGTGVTHYKYKLRVSADPACSNSTGYSAEIAVATPITDNFAALGDGVIQLCVIGRNTFSIWQAESSATTASWTKDSTAPTATLSGVPTGSSQNTSLDITVAGAGVTHYKYKIREAADAACSDSSGYGAQVAVGTHISNSVSALAEGLLEVCVIGRDNVGNWQTEAAATAVSWTKDTTAPVATISNAPTASSNVIGLNVTIAGTGVTHYKFKLRVPADLACSNSSGYSAQVAVGTAISSNIAALADGTIELCVIGKDSAGNWQSEATASTASWTKDTLAPAAIINNAPTGTNNTQALNVSIAGAAVSHYKFKMREAADLACSNSAGYGAEFSIATAITSSLTALADGVLELCVIGRDSAGNWQSEASAAAASWTKDTLPPAATLSGEPTGSSLATTLDISVAGTDVVQYKYKIRESSSTACSDSTGYSAALAVATHISDDISSLADGTIQVCVIGRDSQGNWQLEGTATAVSWTKDTAAPIATLTNVPTGTSNASSLNITVAGTGVTRYKYKIRVAADTGCSDSTGYSGQILVGSPISNSISGLVDGAIELCVIGRDSAGNWQAEASATTANWVKDTAPPTATIGGAPTGSNNTATLNVTIAGAGVSHYKYKLREPSDAACSNGSGYSGESAVATLITAGLTLLGDGVIELCVIGRDSAGNWQTEASAATASWTKDTGNPTVNVGTDILTKQSTAIDASASDGGSGINSYAWTKVSGPGSINFSAGSSEDTNASATSDGNYVLRLTVGDQVGNSSFDELSFVWDTTAPSNPTSVGFGSAYSASTSLSMSWGNSTDSHFSTHNVKICTGNDCSTGCIGTATDYASPANINGVNGTSYYACVQGEDSLGNKSAWVPSLASIAVDTSAPTANSLNINASAAYTNAIAVTLALSATGADEMYVTNTAGCGSGGNWEAYATSKNWSLGQSNTTATVYVMFRDWAGNTSSCINDAIIHDGLTPSGPSISIDAGATSTTSTSVTLTLAATDTHAIEMYVTNTSGCGAGGSWQAFNSSKAWTLGQTGGTATVYAAFRDAAGNVTSCVNDTITHVSGPPTSPAISIESGAATVSDTTATLSLSATGASEMYISNDSSCSAGGSWEAYASSKSWVLSANQSGGATVYVKYRNSSGLESSCVNDSITVQSPNLLTNGDFETGDTTGWTNTVSGKWVVDNTNVNAGTYSAHTNAVANSSNACLTQAVDLTAATEDYVVDFNWFYGTQNAGDFAEFVVDSTTILSQSGASGTWVSNSFLVTKGASRLLKWCYRKNISGVGNGDFVRIDQIHIGPPYLRPPTSVSGVGSNAAVSLTITPPAAAPTGYLILRGTSAVNFTPVNGTTYSAGPLGSYQVVYRGANPTANDTGLTNATTYHYAVYSYDSSNSYSLATTTTAVPWGSYTPSTLTATKGNAQVALSWTVPAGGAQTGYLLVQNPTSDVTFTPVNGTSYSVGAVTGGNVIYKNTGLSYTKTGLTNGTRYYFKVWSYDASNRYSLAYASNNATPDNCGTGKLYNGLCWWMGTVATSCNATCGALGKSYNAAGTYNTVSQGGDPSTTLCRNVVLGCGFASPGAAAGGAGQGDFLCSTSASMSYVASQAGTTTNTGNKSLAGYQPVCACQ